MADRALSEMNDFNLFGKKMVKILIYLLDESIGNLIC